MMHVTVNNIAIAELMYEELGLDEDEGQRFICRWGVLLGLLERCACGMCCRECPFRCNLDTLGACCGGWVAPHISPFAVRGPSTFRPAAWRAPAPRHSPAQQCTAAGMRRHGHSVQRCWQHLVSAQQPAWANLNRAEHTLSAPCAGGRWRPSRERLGRRCGRRSWARQAQGCDAVLQR